MIVVLKLFNSIEAKEIENLRWIRTLGDAKNKMNAKYSFQLPDDLKKIDKTKAIFEARVN